MQRSPVSSFSKKNRKKSNSNPPSAQNSASGNGSSEYSIELTSDLQENLTILKRAIGHSPDVVIREIVIGSMKLPGAIVFVDNLVDKQTIQAEILRSLVLESPEIQNNQIPPLKQLTVYLQRNTITAGEARTGKTLDELSLFVLSGDTVVLVDGSSEFLIIGTRKIPSRNVEAPLTEISVRGPFDSFIEVLRINMALIRRRVRDPNLAFEPFYVGRRGKSELVIAYIKGIANEELVTEVKQRLSAIDIDEAPDSGFIEQLIEDNFLSPFPQAQVTERPDKVASAILQGRVAIMLDGSPFALLVPVTFAQLLQAPEDYYDRWIIGSLIRLLRYSTAFISVFLPALYIALVSFHPGLIPSKLALSIAASREGVPFPAAIEAFLLEATLEILREAGLRLPKPIGPTVGIVGGLVIGEAAVAAGIVSPIMVIIVALGAISSFSIPSYSVAITFRILRFGFMISAAMLGLYGIIIAYIFLNVHIVRLQSFGTVYSAPFAPYKFTDWKDLVLRFPLALFKKRPASIDVEDEERMA
ncbi:spore germination protein [Effusibacillus consociatus]|uniref:Spore germination protein n=1 Tax=Effusibacillus consociatus TaxID=1117041 RepID=A0ABV9Q8A6_9BACL